MPKSELVQPMWSLNWNNPQQTKSGKAFFFCSTLLRCDLLAKKVPAPFFCLMAAWLNEGRCPGGRPSVSTNYITIEANVFCIEMTTVHAIKKHRIKLAVSQRVPFG